MMKLLEAKAEVGGVTWRTSNGLLQVVFCSPSIARIRYTLEEAFSEQESLMLVKRAEAPAVQWNMVDGDTAVELSTALLRILIDKSTGAITYLDASGKLLTREPARGGKTLERIDVIRSVFDAAADIETGNGAFGLRAKVEPVEQVVDRQAFHTKLEFQWQPDEALYGLGSHEDGMMNLRGKHQFLYQQNMKAVVPVLLSTRGYGVLVDSYSLMTFHDDAFGSYIWTDVDAEMDYYFIYGPEFDDTVRGVRYLTGEAPLLPKWAYGYVQSKERYVSQQELIQTVQEYRKRSLPLDCIVLDWRCWEGELFGQKSFDPERFPNPVKMMDDLHDLNARLMISIWPIMRPGGDNHREMHERGFLLGNQANYDAFNEQARELYWKQANEGIFSKGIDAWWCDCTEPFEADWRGAIKPEPEERIQINTAEFKRYLDPQYINAFSLLHTKGIYEGQRAVTSSKRVVNLTRSSYAGQHRYGTITWSGDTAANWETLKKQIANGLNFYATGSPYWTLDIGAFFVHRKPELWFWNGDYNEGVDDLGYRELYVRWFQYGAFLPMFRSHGTDTPREVWRFGEPGEPMYDTLASFLRLRYTLMPYIYSLAGAVTHDSYTMYRTLAFDYREDTGSHDIADQFMFGPAFLVAPVTTAMYYGPNSQPLQGIAKTREVYLPPAGWFNYWNDERLEGGRTIVAQADLETMPLYVRAGSIVPTGPDRQHVQDKPEAAVTLKVYPGADASFKLYEDEGDNYNYEAGAYSWIELHWNDAARVLTLGDRVGSYEGMQVNRQFIVALAGEAGSSIVDYKGERVAVEI